MYYVILSFEVSRGGFDRLRRLRLLLRLLLRRRLVRLRRLLERLPRRLLERLRERLSRRLLERLLLSSASSCWSGSSVLGASVLALFAEFSSSRTALRLHKSYAIRHLDSQAQCMASNVETAYCTRSLCQTFSTVSCHASSISGLYVQQPKSLFHLFVLSQFALIAVMSKPSLSHFDRGSHRPPIFA